MLTHGSRLASNLRHLLLCMSIEKFSAQIPVCPVPSEDAEGAGHLGFPGGPDSGSDSRGGSLEVLQSLGPLCPPAFIPTPARTVYFLALQNLKLVNPFLIHQPISCHALGQATLTFRVVLLVSGKAPCPLEPRHGDGGIGQKVGGA